MGVCSPILMVVHYIWTRLCTWKRFYHWLLFLLHSFSVSKRLPLVCYSLIYLVAFPSFLLPCTTLYRSVFFHLPFLPLFCVYASQFVSREARSTVVVLDAILSWSLSCLYFSSRLPSRFNISCIVFCSHLQTSCLCKGPDVSFARTACGVTQRTHQHNWSKHRYV